VGPFTQTQDELSNLAEQHRERYRSAAPFPHAVLDDLFPRATLEAVLSEFPGTQDVDWVRFRDGTGRKLAISDADQMGPKSVAFLRQLNSRPFVAFLERLTGIPGLIPDHHFVGGGLHQIEPGGFLKIHADFNRHPTLGLDRRLNLLVYLNHGWREEYGGHLELWDPDMFRCKRRVLPIFNRCVVFNATDVSYHGHPEPLTCPEGWSRKSIAIYYYSKGRPAHELSSPHSTIYRRRPGESVYSLAKITRSFLHRLAASRSGR
jgi:hypothetical protein